MIALTDHHPLTPEEYLAFEEGSPVKHEYIDGDIYAMAGTTDSHNTIAINLSTIIRPHLRGTDCRVYFADVKVRLEQRNRFYYPDLLVTCDRRDRDTPTYKRYPKLIIEILSDSTEAFDRGDKFNDYQILPSLEEYVLISSKTQRVEIYRRQAHPWWRYESYIPDKPNLTLASLKLDLKLADVYEDVEFST